MIGGDEPEDMGEANVVREKDLAVCVYIEELAAHVWIPKKVIHDESEVYDLEDGKAGNLVVERWWAVKKGWREEP